MLAGKKCPCALRRPGDYQSHCGAAMRVRACYAAVLFNCPSISASTKHASLLRVHSSGRASLLLAETRTLNRGSFVPTKLPDSPPLHTPESQYSGSSSWTSQLDGDDREIN